MATVQSVGSTFSFSRRTVRWALTGDRHQARLAHVHEAYLAKLARVFGENPDLAFDFYTAASEIVDDLDDYQYTEPFDRDEETGQPTPLGRLREARAKVIELWDAKDA